MPNLAVMPLLARMDEEVAVAFFVVAGLVAVFSIGAHLFLKHREIAYNARLKQLMIERGMTADEITRVISAGPSGAKPSAGGEFASWLGGCGNRGKL